MRMAKPVSINRRRGGDIFSFVLFGAVAIRMAINGYAPPTFITAAVVLAIVFALFILEPILSRRFRRYRAVYFPVQTILILALMLMRPFLDMIAALYVLLAMQAFRFYRWQVAVSWSVVFVAAAIGGMMWMMGALEGLVRSLFIIAACSFVVSFDRIYGQAEDDREQSQALLDQLQAAHARLKDYAAQADELAATNERNRLARELHDSVNQTLFSINLNAQATRLLLERDPARVPEQLDRLQELTGNALARMRALISRLRPPA